MNEGAADAVVDVEALVIGAGFAGLYMVLKLREQEFDVVGVEAGDDVGGTWYWNKYPGARCDIESMLYSYTFDRELVNDWNWSEKYPAQPEILSYIRYVADRYDLKKHFTFSTRVDSAIFDESTSRWMVTTDAGVRYSVRYLISAVGVLSHSKTPEVPGIDTFQGPWYHTGRWPEHVDLAGKKVGVVGTGSSGIQVIPMLAKTVGHLTVFQRTPNFTFPARNQPIDADSVATIRAEYPQQKLAARRSLFGIPVPGPRHSALDVDPEERDRIYEACWQRGHLIALLASFDDLMINAESNATAAEFVRAKIRAAVKDPSIAEALTPTGYALGGKRPCLDTGYFETYNRDNVTLVNLRDEELREVTEKGIRTARQDYEFDALVFATGFDAMTGSLLAMDVRGRGGVTLKEKWKYGPTTYLGLSTADFPNFFTILGPGSPSVLSNMLVSIEQHVEWISELLAYAESQSLSVIEATAVAEKEWTAHVQEVAAKTLYPQTASWFTGANVPGKPRIFMPYVGGVGRYRRACDHVAAEGYRGFDLS
jgi:cation diffusion facilitator CzcD-associated flavoprotein CzcO